MITEERLRAALEAKAGTATPSPTAYSDVQARLARRRLATRLQVAGAALATVALAAGAVLVAQTGDEKSPGDAVATQPPSASKSPSPTPSPSSGPAPTSVTTLSAGVPTGDYVAVLEDGRVVTASAQTGGVTNVLVTLPVDRTAGAGDLALSADRKTVYFSMIRKAPPESAGLDCPVLWWLDVTNGESAELSAGANPQVSPDGRSLAFDRDCQYRSDDSLVVRDLSTGAERTFVNDELHGGSPSIEGPWYLADVVWHADSKRIWVVMDWEDAPELRLLDPASDRTLRDADDVTTEHGPRFIERRGDELAYIHTCCYPESTEDQVVYLRSAAGRDREVVRSPASGRLRELQVGPDGDLLYVQSSTLYRLDVETGETLELGPSTAIGRDW